MQSKLYKKNEIFRKSIRRQQIQKYKSKIREQILQNIGEQNYPTQQFINQRQTYYQNIIMYHTQSNLLKMSKDQLQNHMQMIREIIDLPNNQKFIALFDNILRVFVDYYQESIKCLSQSVLNDIKSSNYIPQDTVRLNDLVQAYSLNKFFNFINPNKLNVIFAGIYFDIKPQQNIEYVKKVIRIVIEQIQFIYNQISSNGIYENIQQNSCRKMIDKSILMGILLNISFSQNEQIIKLLLSHNVYEMIAGIVETYGMDINTLQRIAGLYLNSIQYLYNASLQLYNSQINQNNQTNYDYYTQHPKQYYLYISLFEQMINLSEQHILEKMTRVGAYILKATPQLSLNQNYIINLSITLIRNILSQYSYIDGSQMLFIEFANVCNFTQQIFYQTLIQFLKIIINNENKVYFNAKANKYRMKQFEQEQGWQFNNNKIVSHINQLIRSCTNILIKNQNTTNKQLIQFQKTLIQTLFHFWTQEELINAEKEFLHFVTQAILIDINLPHYIIITNFQEEIIQLILTSIQKQLEPKEIIILILKVLSWIQQSISTKEKKEYFENWNYEWRNIKCFMQQFIQRREIWDCKGVNMQCLQFVLRILDENDI